MTLAELLERVRDAVHEVEHRPLGDSVELYVPCGRCRAPVPIAGSVRVQRPDVCPACADGSAPPLR